MIGNAAKRFNAQGNLTDEPTKDHIRRPLRNLMEWTGRLNNRKEVRSCDCSQTGGSIVINRHKEMANSILPSETTISRDDSAEGKLFYERSNLCLIHK